MIRKLPTLLLLTVALVACNQQQEEPEVAVTSLDSDKDKYSYGLGMMIGERVLKQYEDVDYDLVLAGMKAQHQDETTLLSLEEAGDALNTYMEKAFAEQSAANRTRGEEFLRDNAGKEGVTTTESGLQYKVLTAGDGPKPGATDQVTVHYRGTLIDGTEFDSSYGRGEPTSFALNQVIPGWSEGVQLMSVGSKYQFFIPYDLAYGERGAGGSIGPFEALIFEVELIEIGS